MAYETKIAQTDGSNGYQPGTWEWQIRCSVGVYFEGGYDSVTSARRALRAKVRALRKAKIIE